MTIKDRQAIVDLINSGATNKEIENKTGAKYAQIAQLRHRLKSPKTTISQPQSKGLKELIKGTEKEVAETTEPLTVEPIPITPIGIEPSEIAKAETVKQALTSQNIEAIFSAINGLLPEKYQRPKEQIELLGSVWEAPLNRIMAKYIDQNSDVYVAIVVTILVFAPAPVNWIRDRATKKKEKEVAKTTV